MHFSTEAMNIQPFSLQTDFTTINEYFAINGTKVVGSCSRLAAAFERKNENQSLSIILDLQVVHVRHDAG